MHAIAGQQYQHDEIGGEQQHVKGIGVVEAAEGVVEKMRTDVLPQAAVGYPHERAHEKHCRQEVDSWEYGRAEQPRPNNLL